jgi:hypothetical protein
VRDGGERVFDVRRRCWVRVCRLYNGPGECHRCGLLTVSNLCDFCRVELGVVPPRIAHDALIA